MANRYRQSDITALTGKPVFFDANVLIYIFWPVPAARRWSKQYSKLFNLLLQHGNCLVLNTTILSEVINRVIRTELRNYNDAHGLSLDFKHYRDSPDGQTVQNDIYNIIVKTIFPCFEICDIAFQKNDVKTMLQVDTLDFNDKIIAAVCKKNQFILLTNDADLKKSDIDILTANHKLLQT